MRSTLEELQEIYVRRATSQYGLADVTQLQHALQAAANAEAAGEPPSMIIASLLHDIGHMIHELGEDTLDRGIDDTHEMRGAAWLAQRFSSEVSEPVRLHVAAKRYLCGTSDYQQNLAMDSRRTLELQGGPMSAKEAASFLAEPFAEAAIRLRMICDAAKNPVAAAPPLDHFLTFVEVVAGPQDEQPA